MKSTPDLRKWPREPIVNPQEILIEARREEIENLHERRGVDGHPDQEEPLESNLKPNAKKQKWPRHGYPETALIKPDKGVNYLAILNDLKKRFKPEEMDVTVQRIIETPIKLDKERRSFGIVQTKWSKCSSKVTFAVRRSCNRQELLWCGM